MSLENNVYIHMAICVSTVVFMRIAAVSKLV